MNTFRFRLIDMAGSELGIIASAEATITEGDTVQMPDGHPVEVVEVYEDEFGQEGGVAATKGRSSRSSRDQLHRRGCA